MTIEEFLRAFPLRAPNIMWFLGAGASAAAGVPTATDLLWDFKRTLYCAETRTPVGSCPDLGEPNLRRHLQQFFDSKGKYPAASSPEEYAAFFEQAFPDEADRRRFLDGHITAATHSYGHLALGALMRMGHARLIWTTNFDRAVEDGATRVLGTTAKLVVSTLDSSSVALQAMNEGRWPLFVKLHGDFQSRRLKNTSEELQTQEAELRTAFVEACKRFGMAIAGYSGRDESILKAMEEGIANGRGFPNGLFWFHKRNSQMFPAAQQFLKKAKDAGVGAHTIEVDTFDELMADVLGQIPSVPPDIQALISSHRPRVSDAPLSGLQGTWPIIRLNALPIQSFPSVCRKFAADIGGTKEVRLAVSVAGAKAVAARTSGGVIAFGDDNELRKAFGAKNMRGLDIHQIQANRLRADSTEFGIIYDALALALTRGRDLMQVRRGRDYFIRPTSADSVSAKRVEKVVSPVTGTIGRTGLHWWEAVRFRMDFRLERLWLLLEPTVLADMAEMPEHRAVRMEFVRERLVRRYNQQWNNLLEAWIDVLIGPGLKDVSLQAFGIGNGSDAAFSISRTTGFSWKAR